MTCLQAIFGFLGVTDATVVSYENANAPEPASTTSYAAAQAAVQKAVAV